MSAFGVNTRCDYCGSEFITFTYSGGGKKYRCNSCRKTFSLSFWKRLIQAISCKIKP